MNNPHFDLLIIGDEILSGKREDKHFATLKRLLSERGLTLSSVRLIGDHRNDIANALRFSREQAWVVFSCGGIGATPDDHTRQAAAIAFEKPLGAHAEAQTLIKQRIQSGADHLINFDDVDMQRRLEMGVFPQGATLVPNPFNGIAGFSLESHYFLPGFPVMAEPMMAWVLDTHYRHFFQARPLYELAVVVFEVAESLLTPLMEKIETDFLGVKVFSLPSVAGTRSEFPRRHIELGVKWDGDGKGYGIGEADGDSVNNQNQPGSLRSSQLSSAQATLQLRAAFDFLKAALQLANHEFIELPPTHQK